MPLPVRARFPRPDASIPPRPDAPIPRAPIANASRHTIGICHLPPNDITWEGRTVRFDPERHHRRSIRRKGQDYRQGVYFVTITTAARQPHFGEVRNGGRVAQRSRRAGCRCLDAPSHPFPQRAFGCVCRDARPLSRDSRTGRGRLVGGHHRRVTRALRVNAPDALPTFLGADACCRSACKGRARMPTASIHRNSRAACRGAVPAP